MHDPFAPEPIEFRRPRLAGDVLSDTLGFVRDHLADLGRGLLYIVGPVLAFALLASTFLQSQWLGENPLFNPAAETDFASLGAGYFASLGLLMLAWALVYAVGFAYALLHTEGAPHPITVPELWARTKRVLWPVVGTALGLFLLMLASMVLFIIPIAGVFIWLAIWIYLGPATSLVIPARLTDERDFFSAFRRARHLVQGYWWQTVGVFFLVAVVSFVISLMLSLPVTIFTVVGEFNGATESGFFVRAVLTLGSVVSALGYFVYVLSPIAATMHYFNLVTKHEGAAVPDLEERIDAIGQRENTGWDDDGWDEEADAVQRW